MRDFLGEAEEEKEEKEKEEKEIDKEGGGLSKRACKMEPFGWDGMGYGLLSGKPVGHVSYGT